MAAPLLTVIPLDPQPITVRRSVWCQWSVWRPPCLSKSWRFRSSGGCATPGCRPSVRGIPLCLYVVSNGLLFVRFSGFGRGSTQLTRIDQGPSLLQSSVSYHELPNKVNCLLTTTSERALINGDWSRTYPAYFGLVRWVGSLRYV